MGKVWHPDLESLSALADGELGEPEAGEIRAHVTLCRACAADLATFGRTDALLAAPSTDERSWEALRQALVSLPAGRPSARVDRAIAAMVREQPASARPSFWPPQPAGVAVRVAVAAMAAVAMVIGVVGQGGAPELARPSTAPTTAVTAPEPKTALVAAVQTSVLHAGTNTLYVLQSAAGAVDAYNAQSFELKAQITLGGRPSALALNPADDLVVVLDSSLKTLTEIDPDTNHVIATTTIDVPGTPTSVQVDNGKYVVTSIPDVATGPGPAPLATPGAPTAAAPTPDLKGQVTLIDTATKKIEVTRAVDVAPRLVVPDPSTQFSLLVSPDVTTLVDAGYMRLATLPGGIAAAFDVRKGRDLFAILSDNRGAADLTFGGKEPPAAVHLDGKPYAMTGLPQGGFAVLVGDAAGGHIVVIGPNGKADRTVDVAAVGPTLEYDGTSGRFTVTSDGAVASVVLGPVAIVETPAPTASAQPQASTSASPAASPSAAPSAAASPSASPVPAATAEPLPSQPVNEVVSVPSDVIQVGSGFYRLPLPHAPVLATSSASRMWFVDSANGLNTLNVENGDIFRIAQLPGDAQIRTLVVGDAYVYLTDPAKGRLFVFSTRSEELSVHDLPALEVSAAAITSGDGLVLALPGSEQLLVYRPLSQRFSSVEVGTAGADALAADGSGRIWFAAGRTLGYYDAAARKTVSVAWAGGPITQLVVDKGGVLWAGTGDGQVWSVNGGLVTLALALGSPLSDLAVDPAGQTWYLAPGPSGFRYGPVAAGGHERTVPGPAIGLAPNSQGRAWLADPLGGLYLGLAR